MPDPPAQGASNACRDDRSAVCNGRGSISDRPLPGLRPGGRGSASPLHAVVARHRCNLCVRWWRIPPPSGRGQAVPDPPAREGRGMTPSPGYGCRSRRGWAPAVRPGLKPRAESPSPLKGAVRRPGARVDRLGAGVVGVSRLQPAWGLSPVVHGRAIVDTAARLIRAACRARRVGHVESPRHPARRARQRLAPTGGGWRISSGPATYHGWAVQPSCVGVRRCLTRRPARAGNPTVRRSSRYR